MDQRTLVNNAVGLDGQRRCARQPDVQSKLDVPDVSANDGGPHAEHPLNLARQIGIMATRIDRRILAMSDAIVSGSSD